MPMNYSRGRTSQFPGDPQSAPAEVVLTDRFGDSLRFSWDDGRLYILSDTDAEWLFDPRDVNTLRGFLR